MNEKDDAIIRVEPTNVIGDGKGKSYNVKFMNSVGQNFDIDIVLSGTITKEIFEKESKMNGIKILSMVEIPN